MNRTILMVRILMQWGSIMQLAHVIVNNTIMILQPVGRLDINQARDFEIATNALLNGKKFNVIVDMSDVEYISSSYIRVLISLKKYVYNDDSEFRVCNPNAFCRKIIELVQLDKLVEIYPTVQDAIASIE